MYVRVALLQSADQFQEIVERQIRMQAADNMKFRGPFAHTLRSPFVDFFQRKRVSAGSAWIPPEGAKFAVRDAHVGGVDVAIHVVIGDVAVTLLAHIVGKPAYGEKVGCFKKRHALIGRKSFAGEHLVGDRFQSRVVQHKFSHVGL